MDLVLENMLSYFFLIPVLTIALSQGGDHIGGKNSQAIPHIRRKCMNSFICSVERPFQFFGRVNEDVNTYTTLSRNGQLFFTVIQAQLVQKATQSNSGGMTEMYLDSGTYIKSFYTVMYCPSGVKIGLMGDPRHKSGYRLHHQINWHHVAPKILRETHRKASAHG